MTSINRLSGLLAAAAALFLFAPAASGQEAVDTTSFNALEYSMQKRYRPGDAEFVSNSFTDNTFIRFQAGSWRLFRNNVTGYAWGPSASISYGKMLNRYNGVSVGGTVGELGRNADAVRVWNIGIDASHSFDLVSYFSGYDPSRVFGISTVEGLELGAVHAAGGGSLSIKLHIGLDFRAAIASDFDIFFAPSLVFGNDGIDRAESPRKCHGGYAFNFGLLTHLNRYRADAPEKESFFGWLVRDAFVSAQTGAQMQISDLVWDTAGRIASSRETFALSYGRLLAGPLSCRLSAFYGRDVWKEYSDDVRKSCFYFGLREELMFDPMYWYKDGKGAFSLPFLLGPEAGLLVKPDNGYTITRPYLGLTGGFQCLFKFGQRYGVFLEPRFSLVPYSWKTVSGSLLLQRHSNYYDTLVALQLGFTVKL